MPQQPDAFDCIIIGGSYAGLSAAMTLGRSIQKVLIIDSGKPCNWQTPHAHNLLAHDGETPAAVAATAKKQVAFYTSVSFVHGTVTQASGSDGMFEIVTSDGQIFASKKLLLCTGVRDIPLPIEGFSECWGISALHCPYCHGYEVRNQPLGIIANGEMGFEFARLIHNWSKHLTLFTNGASTLSKEQTEKLHFKNILIVEKAITVFDHQHGQIQQLVFADGSSYILKAVFAKGPIEQQNIIQKLGCALIADGMFSGLIKIDDFGKTSVPGVFAAGDNCSPMRSLAMAIAAGNKTGAFINNELIREVF